MPDNLPKLSRGGQAILPEKVLQFGEGNFLRGFVDWMVDRLNRAGLFGGSVVVVQPIAQGMASAINAQGGLYTLLMRGLQDGKPVDQREQIASISRALNPYEQFDEFLAVARDPNVRVIVSNTTEAGIAFRPEDGFSDRPQQSFPGKLTRFLFERFSQLGGSGAPGFLLLPCELIDRNGDNLKRAVFQTAEKWKLPADFLGWLDGSNEFANTLVDRIVSGYPREEAPQICRELGYLDQLLVAGEPFHFWAIEADAKYADLLPFEKVGLNVVWTRDMTPYRERKVRILNGAHTMTVLAAFLMGKNTVGECMSDELIRTFMLRGLNDEIIPTLDLPLGELQAFAAAVVERFSNPFVKHNLLSIALNSVSKFKARVLPSIRQYIARRGAIPQRLAFSLAALIAFYRGTEIRDGALVGRRGEETYPIRDDADVIEFFRTAWSQPDVAKSVLGRREFWGEDLNQIEGLEQSVRAHLDRIIRSGARAAMAALS